MSDRQAPANGPRRHPFIGVPKVTLGTLSQLRQADLSQAMRNRIHHSSFDRVQQARALEVSHAVLRGKRHLLERARRQQGQG